MARRYFELAEGTSKKFWEIWVDEADVHTRYGRIGSAGQQSTKSAADAAAARKLHEKLIREKTAKGYLERSVGKAKDARAEQAKPPPEQSAPSASNRSWFFASCHYHQMDIRDIDDEAGGELGATVELSRHLGSFPLVVAIHEQLPPPPEPLYDVAQELAFKVPSGMLEIGSLLESRRIPVPKGYLFCRFYQYELDLCEEDGVQGADHYRLDIWPAPKGKRKSSFEGFERKDRHRRRAATWSVGEALSALRRQKRSARCHAAAELARLLRDDGADTPGLTEALHEAVSTGGILVGAVLATALGEAGGLGRPFLERVLATTTHEEVKARAKFSLDGGKLNLGSSKPKTSP